MSESVIQANIRLSLGQTDGVAVWRNNVGQSTAPRVVKYGLCVGSSDLIGVVTMPDGSGRFVAMELKTAVGRLTGGQRMFLELVRSFGGFGCVCRSVEEAHAAVLRCRAGESQ